ncbi:MAG: DEAD/DEAH box helicase family protein [Bdellovibrionota bacterium]|nr:DEAD/DEAH box helicase family protein [Bdellovibrionota bacterium]
MKFKFKIQPYQTEAVESVINVFKGQGFDDKFVYRRDAKVERGGWNWRLSEDELLMGFANKALTLDSKDILSNIQKVQNDNNVKQSDNLTGKLGACSLDVEMETGTGKTYVYIKTIFELNKKYGWSKFIVVVPSIAIREGVAKSFKITKDHFMEYYGKKAHYFVYDSKDLTKIDDFSKSPDINVMIINIQAFNARGKDARRISMKLDEFESRRPIDVIKANHPIVILDEPQKMGGSATKESLKEFNPLFCLNYSATHKDHHDLVYVLDAFDAYNNKLVKKIEVKGIEVKNLQGKDSYIFFENILISPNKPPMAKLEFEVKHKAGIKRETRILSEDDDLYALSKDMEQYKGYRISDINPVTNTLSFTNGIKLYAGEVLGNLEEKELRRIQIRETILSHFEKEEELFEKGIKTLSLFFIDEVSKYRRYDEKGNELNSEYGDIFEEEYKKVLDEYLNRFESPYIKYLKNIDVTKTHAGYFSIDKQGHKVNSKTERGSDISSDISAYDLILKDKEILLSFENPVRFIFSHSALREGWDNPNVFQICTLKQGGNSSSQKRQEVGRGLRLAVNQKGERQDVNELGTEVHNINKLTVIASDGYKDFVADLQKGIREDLYDRPTRATADYFTGKVVSDGKGNSVVISEKQGKDIYRYLARNNYIDDNDKITSCYKDDLANNTLKELPESVQEMKEGVHNLIQCVFDEDLVNNMISNGRDAKVPENALNDNFYKKEFQTLWGLINHKYTYRVDFNSDELIKNAIRNLNKNLFVSKMRYTVTIGQQANEQNLDKLNNDTSFLVKNSSTKDLNTEQNSSVRYDLIGKISDGTKLTRKTVVKILKGINKETFDMYKENPEDFMAKTIRLIKDEKATMLVEHISYNKTENTYDTSIFTTKKNSDASKCYRAQKNVQDYVLIDGYAKDGKSIEKTFAESLDLASEVCAYAKLPRGFSIPTPLENYSPDWAIAFYKGTVKHIFFIAETKGSMNSLDLRVGENAKIECAKKLFNTLSNRDVVYDVVDNYEHLLDIVRA